jgi:PPM family protein phosphatase
MQLRAFSATHIGKVKDQNEDFYFEDEQNGLFVVADGMGGHAAGEVASRMAVDVIAKALAPIAEELRELAALDTPDGRKQILARLEEAVRKADQTIYARAVAEPEKRGMATTVDVLLLAPGNAFIAHVGDSRVYLLRKGKGYQLTTDHSLANHLYAQGKLAPEEIERIPHKHALMRALGMAGGAQVDAIHLDILRGDRFVVCSDGLSTYFKANEDLLTLCSERTTQETAERLVGFANEKGGKDNITVIAIEIEDPEISRKTLETTQKIGLLQRIALFRDLSYQEMLQILPLTREYFAPADEVVIREGEPGGELFVLLEGGVDVESEGVNLTSLGPGSQFGELALVDDRPRSATVKTNAPSRLLVLRRNDFHDLTRGELAPKLLWNLIFDISDRLRMTSWQLTEQVRAFQFAQPGPDHQDDLTTSTVPMKPIR